MFTRNDTRTLRVTGMRPFAHKDRHADLLVLVHTIKPTFSLAREHAHADLPFWEHANMGTLTYLFG